MKNILVTREEKKSQHIKKSLLKSGFSSIFEPLFQISTLPVKISDSAKYKAAIITSSNACEAIITSCNHQIKIYAISEKSVKKLIDAGFKNIIYASQKNAASLLQKILQTHPKSEAILYFHGPKITVDFVTNLSTHGFKIKGFQAYDLKENQCFSAKLLKFSKLQNLDSVLIFSQNSAEIFAKLCHKHNLLEYFSKPQILCLSDEIAKKVKSLGFQKSSNFEPIPSLKKIYD